MHNQVLSIGCRILKRTAYFVAKPTDPSASRRHSILISHSEVAGYFDSEVGLLLDGVVSFEQASECYGSLYLPRLKLGQAGGHGESCQAGRGCDHQAGVGRG